MRYPTRNPFPVIFAFVIGFCLARTSAAPYIAHVFARIVHAVQHF